MVSAGHKMLNSNFGDAKKAKEDEFYTQLADIEREAAALQEALPGQGRLLQRDDPRVSNFFHYFSYNFEKLGLKKLITTCYRSQERDLFSQNDSEQAIWLEYDGDKDGNNVPDPEEIGINHLRGDGDFRSAESIELLKQADIVVTNPPFSLFREYVAQLIEHDKKFLILGNKNAITYNEIFPLIQANKMWVGHTPMGTEMLFNVTEEFGRELVESGKDRKYTIVDGVVKGRSQACWFTNMDFAKRHEDLILYRTYNPDDYPTYDNYDAIEVSTYPRHSGWLRRRDGRADHVPRQAQPRPVRDRRCDAIMVRWEIEEYPRQTQVNGNGQESVVMKLNDGAAIKTSKPPVGKTYYKVDGESFVKVYARILIRSKEAGS